MCIRDRYSRKTKAVLIDLIDKYQQNASETYNKTLLKNTLIPVTYKKVVKLKNLKVVRRS